MQDESVPDRQEMLNRAVIGLRSQGWLQSYNSGDGCVYKMSHVSGKVRRCAWGWVDPDGTEQAARRGLNGVSVTTLRDHAIGLAGRISYDDIDFAIELQQAHDNEDIHDHNRENEFRELAARHGLVFIEAETEVTK